MSDLSCLTCEVEGVTLSLRILQEGIPLFLFSAGASSKSEFPRDNFPSRGADRQADRDRQIERKRERHRKREKQKEREKKNKEREREKRQREAEIQ